jgi:hypothetical protein
VSAPHPDRPDRAPGPSPVRTVEAFGVAVQAPLPLEGPPTERAPDLVVTIDLTRAPLDPATLEMDDELNAHYRWGWHAGTVAIRDGDAGDAWLDDTTAVLRPGPDGTDDYLALFVLEDVVPRWLSMRGDVICHGAGLVRDDGRVAVVVGPSGVGKSTLAAWWSASGRRILGDDVLRVSRTPAGWVVYPSVQTIRLRPDSLHELGAHRVSHDDLATAVHRWKTEVRIPAGEFGAGPLPLAGVFVLDPLDTDAQPGPGNGPTAVRLGLAEGLGAVARNGFHAASDRRALQLSVFEKIGALVEEVPVHRLAYRRHYAMFDGLAAVLSR